MFRNLFNTIYDYKKAAKNKDEKTVNSATAKLKSLETSSTKGLLDEIISTTITAAELPALKHIPVDEYIDKKIFSYDIYKDLLPIFKLAYQFDPNGIPEEHAFKLACVFPDTLSALNYLKRYHDKNLEPNAEFKAHQAVLFPLPALTKNFSTWINWMSGNEGENLLKNDFTVMLGLSEDLENLIEEGNKKESVNIIKTKLVNDIKNKTKPFEEIEKEIKIEDKDKDKDILKKGLKYINSCIAKVNKICTQYEINQPKGIRAKIGETAYKNALRKKTELCAVRTGFLVGNPFKKISVDMLKDFFELYLRNNSTFSYFIKHGISKAKFLEFRLLDRSQAGKFIPDIKIDGSSFGLPHYCLRKLNVQDEIDAQIAACLGKLSGCCQSFSGEAGNDCTRHGLTSPYGGFYAIFEYNENTPDVKPVLVAQSWAWISQSNAIVIDSIESKWSQESTRITLIYMLFYEKLSSLLLENKECAIETVMVGTGGATTKDLELMNYVIPNEQPRDFNGYRDSKRQVVLNSKHFPLAQYLNFHKSLFSKEKEIQEIQNWLNSLGDIAYGENLYLNNLAINYVLTKKEIPSILKNVFTPIQLQQFEQLTLAHKSLYAFVLQQSKYTDNDISSIKKLIQICNYSKYTNNDGDTLFSKAFLQKRIDFAKWLVEAGKFDINFYHPTPVSSEAVINENIDFLNFLLENKFNMNAVNRDGVSALHLAAARNNDIMIWLIENAKVDITLKKINPDNEDLLIILINNDDEVMIKYLIETKRIVPEKLAKEKDSYKNKLAESLLNLAIYKNKLDFVKWFVEQIQLKLDLSQRPGIASDYVRYVLNKPVVLNTNYLSWEDAIVWLRAVAQANLTNLNGDNLLKLVIKSLQDKKFLEWLVLEVKINVNDVFADIAQICYGAEVLKFLINEGNADIFKLDKNNKPVFIHFPAEVLLYLYDSKKLDINLNAETKLCLLKSARNRYDEIRNSIPGPLNFGMDYYKALFSSITSRGDSITAEKLYTEMKKHFSEIELKNIVNSALDDKISSICSYEPKGYDSAFLKWLISRSAFDINTLYKNNATLLGTLLGGASGFFKSDPDIPWDFARWLITETKPDIFKIALIHRKPVSIFFAIMLNKQNDFFNWLIRNEHLNLDIKNHADDFLETALYLNDLSAIKYLVANCQLPLTTQLFNGDFLTVANAGEHEEIANWLKTFTQDSASPNFFSNAPEVKETKENILKTTKNLGD